MKNSIIRRLPTLTSALTLNTVLGNLDDLAIDGPVLLEVYCTIEVKHQIPSSKPFGTKCFSIGADPTISGNLS